MTYTSNLEELYDLIRDNLDKIPNTKLVKGILRPIDYTETIEDSLHYYLIHRKTSNDIDKISSEDFIKYESNTLFRKTNTIIADNVREFFKNPELDNIFFYKEGLNRGDPTTVKDLSDVVPNSLWWVLDDNIFWGENLVCFLMPWMKNAIMKEEYSEIKVITDKLLKKLYN